MYTSDNDKLFLSQLDDGVYLCQQRQKPYFFPFLSERKQAVAKRYLDSSGFLTYRFYGGYEDSERKVLGLYFYDEIEDFPVTALEITFRKADKLTHRDFLGALMSLGIERDTVGDILVEDGRCVVFVKSEISSYITSQDEQSYVVASLRLDAVVAAVTGLSREKTKQLICSGNVSLNFLPCDNVSKAIESGDSLSIRGKGKYKINGVLGETKKHRTRLSIIHYR